jgi:hypothetical protein
MENIYFQFLFYFRVILNKTLPDFVLRHAIVNTKNMLIVMDNMSDMEKTAIERKFLTPCIQIVEA